MNFRYIIIQLGALIFGADLKILKNFQVKDFSSTDQ